MNTDAESSRIELYANTSMKLAVVNALDLLMRETPFDRVPVSKICENSNISRATFYRYFSDKFAIVQWYVNYIHYQGANEIGRTLSWYSGYYTSEAIVSKHLGFFTNAAKSNDYNSLDQYAPRLRAKTLERTVTEYHGIELTDRIRFMIEAIVQTETRLLPAWHYGEYNCSLEEICRWMVECVPAELREMLDKPAVPRDLKREHIPGLYR